MIEVRQLVKWYGPILALDRVTFQVPAGEIVGFLGPNGAGKTTTLRILTGFMPASGGAARVAGHDVFGAPAEVRRRVGYLPENTPLYPEMRVVEHLHYFGKLHAMPRRDRRSRIDALADRCGLGAILRRPVGQLSKGNRQRVGLAQAMLHDPPVLILDEPTAGLDPTQITEVRKLIMSLAGEKTILLSTHILPEVERTCGRVILIAGGRVAAEGTPAELRTRVRARSRVLVEVRAPADRVREVFAALPDVADVQVEPADDGATWTRAAVTARPDTDPREALAIAAVDQRWPVREMRHEAATLEEFFVQVTSKASAAA